MEHPIEVLLLTLAWAVALAATVPLAAAVDQAE